MKRSSGNEGNSAWFPILSVVLQVAALSLCSWAMTAARNRGRELPGGKTPPPSP